MDAQHPSAEYLDSLYDDARAIAERVRGLAALTPQQLAWKPNPETWSVAECLEHLRVTSHLYFSPLRRCLSASPRAAEGEGYRPTLVGRMFLTALEPRPNTRRLSAPRAFRPTLATVGPGIVERFEAQQGQLCDIIRSAGARDLNRLRFGSPVSKLVRISPGDALTILIRHQQRHLGQIERLLAHPAFPARETAHA